MPTVETLNRRHPDWAKFAAAWELLHLLQVDGIELRNAAQSFLRKRPKELPDVYSERLAAFHSQPIFGPVTGWYKAKLFQREPGIDRKSGENGYWDAFLENADRGGTSMLDWARSIWTDWAVYGVHYSLVDKPKVGDDVAIESRADEKALGLDSSYLVRFDPRQVINWSNDDAGNLKWITIKVTIQEQDGPLDDVKRFDQWYVFDRQNYSVYRAEWQNQASQQVPQVDGAIGVIGDVLTGPGDDSEVTLVATGKHVLAAKNQVPVRRLYIEEDLWLGNRAFTLLCEFLNQTNVFAWGLKMACLPMPVICSQDDIGAVTISEVGYLHLKDPQSKIEWLEPEGKSFATMEKRLDSIREECYRTFYLQAQARTANATAQGASGVSKQIDMAPANDVLNEYGARLSNAITLLCGDIADSRNETVEIEVTGFRFEGKPTLSDIEIAQELQATGIGNYSPTAEKESIKNVIISAFDDKSQELKETMLAEVDAAPTSEERAQQAADQQAQLFQQSLNKASSKSDAKQDTADLSDALAA